MTAAAAAQGDAPQPAPEDQPAVLTERLMRTADATEGPRAFAEKRAPNWQAR